MKRRGRPKHPDVLTPREWEVLDLIREGLSNDAIAQRLGISIDGAKFHVSEILSKLGLENRSDAARWRPEEARPWWTSAAAPLALWRRLGWLSPALTGVLALAVAAGIGVLVWALVATRGGDKQSVAVVLPAGDKVAYSGTDERLWLLDSGRPARRIAPDTGAEEFTEQNPVWSPDGRYILFQQSRRVQRTTTAISGVSLWLFDTQTDDLRRVAYDFPAGSAGVSSALWAPDSRQLAFIAANGLWTGDLEGNVRQLVGPAFGVDGFAWSPDGTRLALDRGLSVRYPDDWSVPGAHAEIPQENGLYVVDAGGSEPRPVALVPAIDQAYRRGEAAAGVERGLAQLGVIGVSLLDWSPDGAYVAFQAPVLSVSASADGEALFSVPTTGGTPVYHGRMLLSRSLLDWFPASHRFVFTLGSGRETHVSKQLAVAEGGVPGAQVIAEDDERIFTPERPVGTPPDLSIRADGWPAVSPDGTRIVFQASESRFESVRLDIGKVEGPREGIWAVNADGSDPRQLTSHPDYLDFFPQWSADGQAILFVRTNGRQFVNESTPDPNARAELWIMRADGSGAHPLVDNLQRIGSYYGLFPWEQDVAWYRATP